MIAWSGTKFGPPIYVTDTCQGGAFARLSVGAEYGIRPGQKIEFYQNKIRKNAAGEEDEEQGVDMRPYVSINQEDIVNKTDNPNANFKGLIDHLNHELVECGLYRVMNMEDLVKTIKKNDRMKVAADDGGNDKVEKH